MENLGSSRLAELPKKILGWTLVRRDAFSRGSVPLSRVFHTIFGDGVVLRSLADLTAADQNRRCLHDWLQYSNH